MNLKEFCISLAKAESEKEVIALLKEAGYWDNPSAWRYYGDNENNFAVIGNQQSSPDAALVEKIINSVDAVLMRECLRRGIDPESDTAPRNIIEALEEFFGIYEGRLSILSPRERTNLAENIILMATGKKSTPSYSIIDKGEGQSPKRMPETFLSLNKSNKLRIPFVQGKFNMGGTGSLQFCGKHNLQLIISKRDPQIAKFEDDETADFWGFTIVRRMSPEKGMKNSTFKYLAPNGEILKFRAKSLPILPGKYPEAYTNPLEWGSFIKLYEYQLPGRLKGPASLDLYNRLSLLLPNIALPVRIFERRKGYRAHTYETTMSGLSVRLDEDKRENLEQGFPSSSGLKIMGQEMNLQIYAFKKGKRKKREKYSENEGIIFTIEGQAQGFIPDTFFARKSVGLSYLQDSILVLVDCSNFDARSREDLFMNSRDRLRDGELKRKIEKELEELLRKHPGLRELKERRRREEIEGKIGESKPLIETIEKIIKRSPTLSKLFVEGVKLTNPFDLRGVQKREEFKGKKHPTFFKLRNDYPLEKPKQCPINRRFRVQFETDAENEYFKRDSSPGKFYIWANGEPIDEYSLNLWNGLANLTVKLPEGVKVGDILHFECKVVDELRIEPFYNEFYVKVDKPQTETTGKKGEREKPPGESSGDDRKMPSHLDLPTIREARKKDWDEFGFNKEDALLVRYAGEEKGYGFIINMDNIHLQTEIKGNPKADPKLLEAQYKYGMTLIGLALLKEFEANDREDKMPNSDRDIYKNISIISKAISPFLLPMISSLGKIESEI